MIKEFCFFYNVFCITIIPNKHEIRMKSG